ncbi:MAG: DNA repair protein [Flavobacterium sp.]|nr:MAG: DNA repair protein [Flavobacterium sp.]
MVNNLTRVSEVTIAYRPKFKASTRPQITKAEDAYQILINQWDKDTIELLEEFKVMLLNRQNKVLGVATISVGGLDKTVVDPKVVFAIALKAKASSIILAHNHPSSNINTSLIDKQITKKLKQGGEILDINIHDHIIVTCDGYYSYADDGLM